jgi:5'-nucleotidase
MPAQLSRRAFLKQLLLAGGGVALSGCARAGYGTRVPPTPIGVAPATPTASTPPTPGEPVPITFLHYNDLHGALLAKSKGDSELGGVANLAGQIDRIRASAPGPVLLLDAGDTYQGTYVSNSNQGQAVIEILNVAGVDALALGNHEFDWGLEVLNARIEQARFPFLAANLEAEPGYKLETLLPGLLPYTVVEVKDTPGDPLSIGILGLTYHDLKTIVRSSAIEGLRSLHPAEAVRQYLPELRKTCDLVIVLSHLGLVADTELVHAVPEIPLIVGGHSHRVLKRGARVGETLIVQAGAYGEYLGQVAVLLDREKGQIASDGPQSEVTEVPSDGTPNDKIQAIVNKWSVRAEETGSQVVGESAVPLKKARGIESALGNLITDAMRAADLGDGQPSAIALHNDGGIRADLNAGEITYAELYSVLPFDNSLIGLDLTGTQVLGMLEASINDQASEVQVSGLTFVYNPNKPPGQRVPKAQVDGEPLDPTAAYRVVTIDYLYSHPQYSDSLGQGTNVTYDGLALDAVIDYIRAHSPVHPQVEQRIRRG